MVEGDLSIVDCGTREYFKLEFPDQYYSFQMLIEAESNDRSPDVSLFEAVGTLSPDARTLHIISYSFPKFTEDDCKPKKPRFNATDVSKASTFK